MIVTMPTFSACVVIFDEDRTHLVLHQREGFQVWALPGGSIEPGETENVQPAGTHRLPPNQEP